MCVDTHIRMYTEEILQIQVQTHLQPYARMRTPLHISLNTCRIYTMMHTPQLLAPLAFRDAAHDTNLLGPHIGYITITPKVWVYEVMQHFYHRNSRIATMRTAMSMVQTLITTMLETSISVTMTIQSPKGS